MLPKESCLCRNEQVCQVGKCKGCKVLERSKGLDTRMWKKLSFTFFAFTVVALNLCAHTSSALWPEK